MARDQLLISQKFTPNHLPSSITSQGIVGTYSQGNSPSSARYKLGKGVHARHAAEVERHFARRNMRRSVTGTPASLSAR